MIRIFFSSDDLARFRIATAPDPLWEVLLSLHMLQTRTGSPVFRRWSQQIRSQLSPSIRPLLHLAPARGYSPDFLTPAAGADGLAAGIDAVLATPVRQLRDNLEQFAEYRPASNWTRSLADGETDSLRRLASALGEYHRTALAPFWTHIRAEVDADRASRARILADEGFGGLMASLHPDIRWRSPVLELHGFTISRDIHLDGRGLRLIPSFFCWQQPILLRDADLPPVLVYPVERGLTPLGGVPAGVSQQVGEPLVALLGRTRAAVLRAVEDGCTTTELARRVGVSPATASQHATVLREAGLITTRRLGGSVLHSLHPRGADFLLGR